MLYYVCFITKDIWKCLLYIGERLDLPRSETMPLIEKGTQEHKVTIENETGCKDDLNQDILESNESSINECARGK
jgi:hypothetical protein